MAPSPLYAITQRVQHAFDYLFILIWDVFLVGYNLLVPKRARGCVIPEGKPGHRGAWPPYVPPKQGDSRSPCPALNAMANHGILPHDGNSIPCKELERKV
jgi:hypothetical protein